MWRRWIRSGDGDEGTEGRPEGTFLYLDAVLIMC